MKKIVFFTLLSILTSCAYKSDQTKPALIVDRVNTMFKNFKYSKDSARDSVEFALARGFYGDILQNCFYVENKEKFFGIGFYVKDGRFEYVRYMIPEVCNSIFTPILIFPTDSLVAIDTIYVSIRTNRLAIYKYEFANPPDDGVGGCLFCENYGLVGFMNYAWGNRYFLTRWNNIDFEDEVRRILQDDDENRFFLNRNKTFYSNN